jgi:hypothetical protein
VAASLPGITESLGWYAIRWIKEFLVHGPGDVQGTRIDLDDEFAEFLIRAYELNRRGERKVRRAFLSRAKGRNKSGFAAMVCCFEALGECRFDHWATPGEVSDWGYEFEPGEPVGRQLTYAEVLNVATEEGQAGNTYDAVYYMLHPDTCSAELLDRFGNLDIGLTRTNLPDFRGFIEPVSASNDSKDGGKSTFIVADESHLWTPPATGVFKLGRMHQTMVRNLLKRKESSGWMLETSTMYVQGEGSVAEGTHKYAKKLAAASGRKTAVLLFDHKQASDDFDLSVRSQRLAALREAYGPASAWMNLSAIADYWDDPQASEEEFRRFWLNQPVAIKADRTVFDLVKWTKLEVGDDVAAPQRVAMVVHVADYQASSTIAVAGELPDGSTAVLVHCGEGMSWVAGMVAELVARRDIVEMALATGEARGLEGELVRAGIEFGVKDLGKKLNGTDIAASCTSFQAAVTESAAAVSRGGRASLRYYYHHDLDGAVAHAKTRRMGAAETWEEGTGSALIGAAAAYHRWRVLADVPYDVLASVL